ncbi:MAG: DMT family transporter, partial [Planctomycetota bacterium]
MTGPAARFAPHAVMLVLIVIWAASYATSKMALQSLDPFALVAVRFWLALLCVAPFLGRTAFADLRTALGPGLVTGLALGTGYLLQMAGLNETSSATSGLIAGLIVPLVAVGGFLFFGARLGARSLAGLALA